MGFNSVEELGEVAFEGGRASHEHYIKVFVCAYNFVFFQEVDDLVKLTAFTIARHGGGRQFLSHDGRVTGVFQGVFDINHL